MHDRNDIETAMKFSFVVKIKCITRENCLFNIMRDAQKLGDKWHFSGRIEWRPSLWSNNPYLIGIKAINIEVDERLPPKTEVDHNDD